MSGPQPLPYRTDSVALASWLEARARGRSAEQLRLAAAAPKGVEGTATAAAALGFVDPSTGALTEVGEQFALAPEPVRRALLGEALRTYPPYDTLLQAIQVRAEVETEVRWIEAWWATQGFGSSESNRREGAAAFGRLAEFAGLAEYIPGRRGRPTRLRWTQSPSTDAQVPSVRKETPITHSDHRGPTDPDLFSGARESRPHEGSAISSDPATTPSAPLQTLMVSSPPSCTPGESPASVASPGPAVRADTRVEPHVPVAPSATPGSFGPAHLGGPAIPLNRITLPLESGAVARIEVPWRLPRAEKRRLLDLLHLLITED